MSKKIATPSAVFDACDQLEAAGNPWNRDDVRSLVGGGSFNAIEPLIKAWRRLQPVREIAPSTPTELLNQIAQTIEGHYSRFIAESERRVAVSKQALDGAAQDLTERIAEVEAALEAEKAKSDQLRIDNERIAGRIQLHEQKIEEKNREIAALTSANDALHGTIRRMEEEKASISTDARSTIKTLEDRHEARVLVLQAEHRRELEQQRKQMLESAEQAEDRWMRQLDLARTEHKKAAAAGDAQLHDALAREKELRDQLTHARIQLQKHVDSEAACRAEIARLQAALEKRAAESTEMALLKESILAMQQRIEAMSTVGSKNSEGPEESKA